MILSNFFVKRKVNELVCSAHRQPCFKTLDEVKNILILYDLPDVDEVQHCILRLKKMGKQVNSCVYVGLSAVCSEDASCLFVHAKKDIDWRGIPSKTLVDNLQRFSPDMLIDFTKNNNYCMHYLMLRLDCNFRVGIKGDNRHLYDFSISVTERCDINYLFEQIIFYLQCIRSK